jgi:hypothetical protein
VGAGRRTRGGDASRQSEPHAQDHELERLVAELSLASTEFARFWADYRLFEHTHGKK